MEQSGYIKEEVSLYLEEGNKTVQCANKLCSKKNQRAQCSNVSCRCTCHVKKEVN